jgi:hypothetical protein
MPGHVENESPGEQMAASGTASPAASTNYDDSSETIADHEPYHRRHPLSTLEEGVSTELHRIATALSRHQSHATTGGQALESQPALNPESADFDVTKWVRNFMAHLNDQGHKSSHLGVLFRDLDVFGSGSALQLQETVDSVLLAPLRLGEAFGSQKKQHKHILHGFNGLLKSGELLAVLGRPGSGCSTFLKSMCGELHGLTLGKQSTIHYNGASQKQMTKEFKGEVIYNQEVCHTRVT